jgi:transposase
LQFADPLYKTVIDSLVNDLKQARKTRSSLLKQIRKVSQDISTIQLLKTVPGVGLLTAFSLYAELVDINRFKNIDNLASYVGLVPSIRSSDTTINVGGITNRHCTHLRSTIIESAWVAIRNDEALLFAFNKLVKSMKKTDAIIRIAKKLLNRIRSVWKNNMPYVKGTLEVSLSPKM